VQTYRKKGISSFFLLSISSSSSSSSPSQLQYYRKMSKLLAIAILLLPLINHGIDFVMAWDDKDFFKYCPPSQCSQHGPEIRFPFCLESSNTSSSSCGCGSRSIKKLACTGQDTILLHPVLGPYNVSAIDYTGSSMKLNPLVEPCMAL
jgi:hypothetical protein